MNVIECAQIIYACLAKLCSSSGKIKQNVIQSEYKYPKLVQEQRQLHEPISPPDERQTFARAVLKWPMKTKYKFSLFERLLCPDTNGANVMANLKQIIQISKEAYKSVATPSDFAMTSQNPHARPPERPPRSLTAWPLPVRFDRSCRLSAGPCYVTPF